MTPREIPRPDPGPKVVPIHPPDDSFDAFWLNYPKKVGKMQAKALWDRITNGGMKTKTLIRDSGAYVSITLQATPAEILEGVKKYRRSQIDPATYKLKDNGKYVAHPATFLNQGRWEDEA